MTKYANGGFEVKLTPQRQGDEFNDSNLSNMVIDKKFQGDLEAH